MNPITSSPLLIAFKIACPVDKSTKTTGIVTEAPSVPPFMLMIPSSRFTIITATAPAFCAFNAFTPNPQLPIGGLPASLRNTIAIFPAKLPAGNAVQPLADAGFP